MIYKDFVAETSAKILSEVVGFMKADELFADNEELKDFARGSVVAAKMLADELEADFQNEKTDGGLKRYSDNETFFDNYVNWTKNV